MVHEPNPNADLGYDNRQVCEDCDEHFTPRSAFDDQFRCGPCAEKYDEAHFNDEDVPSDWWSGGICENH
jgi:hypothetical protein